MLTISNYSKSYNDRLILAIDSLTLGHGIYWLKGENGSGKSTLFKSICGIIPFEGSCTLEGLDVKKQQASYRKLVNYSEAEPIFPEFLTQKDLVQFTAKAKGADLQQIDTTMATLGTKSYFDQPVGTYSSGMLKKTGLVMAFLGKPKLIVLDEPFITIDHQSVQNLVALINAYYQSGTTFLISSHTTDGSKQLSITKTFHIENQSLFTL